MPCTAGTAAGITPNAAYPLDPILLPCTLVLRSQLCLFQATPSQQHACCHRVEPLCDIELLKAKHASGEQSKHAILQANLHCRFGMLLASCHIMAAHQSLIPATDWLLVNLRNMVSSKHVWLMCNTCKHAI